MSWESVEIGNWGIWKTCANTPYHRALVNVFCTARECCSGQPPRGQRHKCYFAYWTLKEAYIKAHGRGMSIPLNCFSFTFPQQNTIHLHIDADQDNNAERWQFWQFRHEDSYLLSICAERWNALPPALRFHRMVPTVSEEVLRNAPCATSGWREKLKRPVTQPPPGDSPAGARFVG